MKPKLLLLMTNFIEMDKLMTQNLAGDFEVEAVIYSFDLQRFEYNSFSDRIRNFYQKLFFKNRKYKELLKKAAENKRVREQILQKDKNFDYVMVLSVEYFEDETLELLKSVGTHVVGYQWDGLQRSLDLRLKVHYFDRFYCFNREDTDHENIFFATNFYLPTVSAEPSVSLLAYDLLYIGTATDDRLKKIEEIVYACRKVGKVLKVFLLGYGKSAAYRSQYPYPEITFLEKGYTYEECLREVLRTKAILDLKLPVHDGLSFRFFEAMHYNKLLLTDNISVKGYDFYREKNIVILNEDIDWCCREVTERTYLPLPQKIVEQYDVRQWIKTLLSIP